jgi:cobalt-zinc-cadmium efflux system protein
VIRSLEMLVIAAIGLAVNVVVALILRGHDHEHQDASPRKQRNLNVHSAFLHVLGDMVSSFGVIIAALLIRLTSAHWIDPLVSILIGAIILVSAYRVLRRSLHILIEGVPEGLSVSEVNQAIRRVAPVESVHDLHVWNLCSDHISLSAHIVLSSENTRPQAEVMTEITQLLQEEYGIGHTTLQLELSPYKDCIGGCN